MHMQLRFMESQIENFGYLTIEEIYENSSFLNHETNIYNNLDFHTPKCLLLRIAL